MTEPHLPLNPPRKDLRITELFVSLQGETSRVGLPTVFIRLTGCPLRCVYCDSAYAFHGGQWHTLEEIVTTVQSYATPYVTVTGGEPLAQKKTPELLKALCDAHYRVSLETSGAFPIDQVDPRVSCIVDIKTPGSGEHLRNCWENVPLLQQKDEVKFVICDRADYEWSVNILQQYELATRSPVLFSPSYGVLSAGVLADWIVADRLPVRFQIQLHKYLWGDVPGK